MFREYIANLYRIVMILFMIEFLRSLATSYNKSCDHYSIYRSALYRSKLFSMFRLIRIDKFLIILVTGILIDMTPALRLANTIKNTVKPSVVSDQLADYL